MSPNNLFLTVIEGTKSYINRVETTNTEVRLDFCWHFLLVLLFEKTEHFTSKRVYKIHLKTKPSNQYPLLTLPIVGLRVDNGKSVIAKSWNIVRGKWNKVPIIGGGARLIIFWKETLSISDFPCNSTKLVNCNQRHLFPQYNEFSTVF